MDKSYLDLTDHAVAQWRANETDYPRLVARLERIVDSVELNGEPNSAPLRRVWGQLELINALEQDEDDPVESQEEEILVLLGDFRQLLRPSTN